MAAAVCPVPVMHEHMHQRTCEKKEERQRSDKVRSVLAGKEVGCDGAHHKEPKGVARAPKARRFRLRRGKVVDHLVLQKIDSQRACRLCSELKNIPVSNALVLSNSNAVKNPSNLIGRGLTMAVKPMPRNILSIKPRTVAKASVHATVHRK